MCPETLAGSIALVGPVKTNQGSVYSIKPTERIKAGDLAALISSYMYVSADTEMCKAFNSFLQELSADFQEKPFKFEKIMSLSDYAPDEYVEPGTPFLAYPVR